MQQSLTKTLAAKLRISVPKVYARYGTPVDGPKSTRRVPRVVVEPGDGRAPLVAQWGGNHSRAARTAVLNDRPHRIWNDRTDFRAAALG
jgi:hypothetical protein